MFDLILHLDPLTVRLRSPFGAVRAHVETFYADAHVPHRAADVFTDADIRILRGHAPLQWLRPQARFLLDHHEPFLPLPAAQAAPLFEWGLNWTLATRPLGFLVVHAAVVARDDAALVMPGVPGAGKSTLCATLTFLDDWRLLSDELAILCPESGLLHPNCRPICLKNASIDVVRGFAGVRLGPVYRDTRKGTVTHAAPPGGAHGASGRPARCRWVVFPRYSADEAPYCEELGRAEAFARIADQSFNRERMGDTGFRALCDMLDEARCFDIGYDSTDRARAIVRDITGL